WWSRAAWRAEWLEFAWASPLRGRVQHDSSAVWPVRHLCSNYPSPVQQHGLQTFVPNRGISGVGLQSSVDHTLELPNGLSADQASTVDEERRRCVDVKATCLRFIGCDPGLDFRSIECHGKAIEVEPEATGVALEVGPFQCGGMREQEIMVGPERP